MNEYAGENLQNVFLLISTGAGSNNFSIYTFIPTYLCRQKNFLLVSCTLYVYEKKVSMNEEEEKEEQCIEYRIETEK